MIIGNSSLSLHNPPSTLRETSHKLMLYSSFGSTRQGSNGQCWREDGSKARLFIMKGFGKVFASVDLVANHLPNCLHYNVGIDKGGYEIFTRRRS